MTATERTINEMVTAALEEDKAYDGHSFDATGFGNFFPEHSWDEIGQAWRMYCANRGIDSIMKGD